MPDAQAEAMLETFVEWRAADVAELATKGDIAALETRMEARFATMTAELRAEIIGAKVDLLKWFIPLFAGQILALMALVVQIVLQGP